MSRMLRSGTDLLRGVLPRLLAICSCFLYTLCFCVTASAGSDIATMQALNAFAHHYYMNPQPERVVDSLRYVVKHGVLRQPHNEASISAFYNCLFHRHSGEWHQRWSIAIEQFPAYEQAILSSLLQVPPTRVLVLQPQSLAKNDMYWGCFFATGDDRYLQAIANGLYYLEERRNKQRFLMASLARWSLVVNAQQHSVVKNYLIQLSHSYNSRWRILATGMLNTTPADISQETATVLKRQYEAGVW